MALNVIVAGTGFANRDGSSRAKYIRSHVRDGLPVHLKREPSNPHDPNAIAVYIEIPFLILWRRRVQIGYIKAPRAEGLAAKMDKGVAVRGRVASFHAPPGRDHPRVSLALELG